MNYYKNVGYYEGFNGKWYCSISYQEFNSKSEVKKFIKSNNTNQGMTLCSE